MAATQKTQDTLLKYGGFAVLGVGAFFLGRKFIREFKKDGAEADLPTDQSAQQAQAFMTAFNPSGNTWLQAADGTDNVKVFELATQVKDFGKVQQYYRDLYKSSLTEDLGKELNSVELARFWAIINGKKASEVRNVQAQKTLAANNFKFKIGDRLSSKPFQGNTQIGYFYIENKKTKLAGKHTLAGAYVGTITGYVKNKVKDYDGKTKWLSGYYVKDLPNGVNFGTRRVFVLERETAKM